MKYLLLLAAAISACGAENVLTPSEQAESWRLLFDGRTMNNWRDPAKFSPPGDSWVIEDGCLKTRLKPRIAEDLVTTESFGDFELKFDWRISPRGNTGVKYRIQKTVFLDSRMPREGGFEGMVARALAGPAVDRAKLDPDARGDVYVIGFECQLIDDSGHRDARTPSHTTGALYSMIAPTLHTAHPAGEWNQGRIVVRGDHFEHWINGVKVAEGSLLSEAVRAGAAKRWGRYPQVMELFTKPKPRGPISLQHHGDEVWFRNIKIRVFD
ncbi:MAG TPA: DUF1080 domain-containing protein [Bryobacteraceae bacterium]|nr:DUF1080 domain-containing protein [Bryobacteraceae bacterium]HOQ44043.1 DUF1080 domain-containing protein [Bryobacteraceae bacterium]HPQ15553.1 DUF1080 domain-containing protein [Bryobacteraceae bacterium]HPU70361.1 DUF1080 domain-containing protein [Bryobacteraceae bacterium]